MNNAKLPKELKRKLVADIGYGEIVYIAPWEVFSDTNEDCWIDTRAPISKTCAGSSKLMVTKSIDGYEVAIARGEYEWNPQFFYYNPLIPGPKRYEPVVEFSVINHPEK